MDKQEFVLTELEAMAKDIILMVDEERRSREAEKAERQKQAERAKQGEHIGALARMHDPARLLPELRYVEGRLDAVKRYLTPP